MMGKNESHNTMLYQETARLLETLMLEPRHKNCLPVIQTIMDKVTVTHSLSVTIGIYKMVSYIYLFIFWHAYLFHIRITTHIHMIMIFELTHRLLAC
jgi:hypothetical protein